MEPGEVRKEIQRITKEVKKQKIVERAVKIAHMGKEKIDEREDHTIIDYTYSHEKLRIHQSNYNWGPYYVQVDFEGCRVFAADFEEKAEGKISEIRVDIYRPGWWTNELDVKKIKSRLEKEKIQLEREREESTKKVLDNRPLTRQEQRQAESLGLIPKNEVRIHSYR